MSKPTTTTKLNLENTDNPYLTDYSVNMGDLNVFGQLDARGNLIPGATKIKREDVVNRDATDRTIWPGDIVNKTAPSSNYAYFWHKPGDDDNAEDELEYLMELGYFRVTAKEFWARRWKTDSQGHISAAGRILMALPESLWLPRQRKKLGYTDSQLDKQADGIHTLADGIEGVGSYEIRKGELQEKVRARA
jgi:hypothetical protein